MYHHIDGWRESNLSIQDLQSMIRLAESLILKILDTTCRMRFARPSLYVLICFLISV